MRRVAWLMAVCSLAGCDPDDASSRSGQSNEQPDDVASQYYEVRTCAHDVDCENGKICTSANICRTDCFSSIDCLGGETRLVCSPRGRCIDPATPEHEDAAPSSPA